MSLSSRCRFRSSLNAAASIQFSNGSTVDNVGGIVTNCIVDSSSYGFSSTRVGGIIIRDCTISAAYSVRVVTALTVGQSITVNNSLIVDSNYSFYATVLNEIIEDYNNVAPGGTARSAVATGANSKAYITLPSSYLLCPGFVLPIMATAALSPASALRAIAGFDEPNDDFYGLLRPVTSAKKSWGAIQYQGQQRSSAQAQAGTYSLNLPDAGMVQFFVPVTAVPTTISVYVYREANYAGTNPQMIIRQPGQADIVVTDTGAAGGWNLLTATLTPAAAPGYVTVPADQQ